MAVTNRNTDNNNSNKAITINDRLNSPSLVLDREIGRTSTK